MRPGKDNPPPHSMYMMRVCSLDMAFPTTWVLPQANPRRLVRGAPEPVERTPPCMDDREDDSAVGIVLVSDAVELEA